MVVVSNDTKSGKRVLNIISVDGGIQGTNLARTVVTISPCGAFSFT